jgi:DinB superfamily
MPKQENDQALREQLVELLNSGNAHASFDAIIKDLPPKLRGKKVENYPHTAWMLLEHLRVAQFDILEFSINAKYKPMKWPEDYWPKTEAPPSGEAWDKSVDEFRRDLKAMQDLVANPQTDLFAKIPWGEGQTVLREALLLADHNSHHLGQLLDVRRLLGAWKS